VDEAEWRSKTVGMECGIALGEPESRQNYAVTI